MIINKNMNFTDGSGSDSYSSVLVYEDLCENITNHWLYLIFTGYLLPILSPRVRNFTREFVNGLKNNEITGKVVTLTEFGFQKIQEIENNHEMKNFVRRMCIEKKIEYDEDSIDKIAWLFSGDSDETHNSITQTWTKLNKVMEELNLKEKRKGSLRP